MVLSDRTIKEMIAAGRIEIDPYEPKRVQPSSVDLRLGDRIRVFTNTHKHSVVDLRRASEDLTELVALKPDEPFILHPHEFVLGITHERVGLPDDLVGRLEGKALAIDTPIPTPTGWRTMGDLQVGDDVFDERGCVCPVVDATDVMRRRPCRRVVFSDGQAIIADACHRWVVVDKNSRKHGLPPSIRTTDEMASHLRTSNGVERNFQIPLAGPIRCPERSLPVEPYVLGAWLGDGTSTAAELTCGDGEIAHEVENAGYAVSARSRPGLYRIGGVGCSRSSATGRYEANGSLSSRLRALGVMPEKHVPPEYLRASVPQRLALLQGLMDTDGYVDVLGRCEFTNTREGLADAVLELAASLGLRPVKSSKRAILNGRDCGPAFSVKFTPDMPVFRLPRKVQRLRIGSGGHRFRAISSIEVVDSVPVRCIQVGTASGLFLAGKTFIPTHNSSLGRLGLLIHSTAGFVDPGWRGRLTLELANILNLPITLYAGMPVAQISFMRLTTPVERAYGSPELTSKYQGDTDPTPSKYHLNFDQ